MQRVFVLGNQRQPLMPCAPARARQLLKAGQAAVFRRYPFTIILKDRADGETQPIEAKIDPGSKTTGIALVATYEHGQECIWAGEITHKGQQVKDALEKRSACRRGRRTRLVRHRPARWNNRKRQEGWLPPSLRSRIQNVTTWINRLNCYSPVSAIAQELVKFDTQLIDNPDIQGVEYQQGELAGYEVREYLLEKWGRKCAYCKKQDVPLEIEHLIPKSRGGSNRINNLALACHRCNQKKGDQTATEFGFPDLMKQAKMPLKDAAAVNASRWALYRALQTFNIPLSVGTGGRTKFNRIAQTYPKAHWIDAACVGVDGANVTLNPSSPCLAIKATGRQRRQMVQTDKYGFPKSKAKGHSVVQGFRTGDIARAILLKGKYAGMHVGRLVVKSTGTFSLNATIPVNYKHCQVLHHHDGYDYSIRRVHDYDPAAVRRDKTPR